MRCTRHAKVIATLGPPSADCATFAAFRADALGVEQVAVTFQAAEPRGKAVAGHAAPVHDHVVFAKGNA